MNLVLGSCFRQSAGRHVALYANRVALLKKACDARGIALHVISIWGDSTDRTKEDLEEILGALRLHELVVDERSHGFPNYGSSEHPDRLAGFALAANGVFEHVGAGADFVIYVESDLIWTPGTLLKGVQTLQIPGREVLAIPTFCGPTDVFYDTWGFRTPDGRRLGPLPPYWEAMHLDRPQEIGTAGGCLVMTGEVARACRCSKEEALVGFCKDARSKGYRVWTDWRLRVEHP